MSNSARANIEITASTNRLMRGLANAGAAVKSWASASARGIGSAFAGALSKLNKSVKLGEVGKNALGHFGGELATRGLDALTGAAGDVRNFERTLVRYQITANGTADSTAAMRKEIDSVARATGIAREEVLGGASTYVALTGDVKGATNAMGSFARISQASGASVEDVATATAALQTSMGIGAGDVEAAFSGMIVQGKAGAVELRDMAGNLATLAPQFAQFRGGTGLAGIREMGSAFQVIRTGAGSAGEAATQFESIMGELAKPEVSRKLKQLGVSIFDKDAKTGLVSMRNASDIFEDLAKNQKLSDPRLVAAIFGRKEAQQAVRSIRNHIDMYRQLKDAAMDTGAVQRDLGTYLESDAGRIDKAMNNMKVSIAEAFTPDRIAKFADLLENAAGKVDKLLKGFDALGEKVGNFFGQGKRTQGIDYATDKAIADFGEYDPRMAASGMTKEKFEAKKRAAQMRVADAEKFDAAAENILGGEVDGSKSDESVRRAFAAKYTTLGNTEGGIGEREAGSTYLRKAHVDDPVAVAIAAMRDITGAGQQTQVVKAIRDGFVEAAKSMGFKVDIGRDKVADGVKNSATNRTNAGKKA